MTFSSIRQTWYSRLISVCLMVTFVTTMLITPNVSFAQGGVMGLPQPGTMVDLSPTYVPLMVTGLTIHPENPLLIDFIVSTGNSGLDADQVKKESDRLIKYFLACLTIPENDQWVNLSPYEKDRIVPEDLGQTVLGQDMLAQDYLLKQLTASLIYPEKNLGKNFWDKVYAKASQMYGTTQLPMNTFNKVWILPQYAKVYEHNDTVLVVKSHLKVMLDEDYLALNKHTNTVIASQDKSQVNNLGSQIVRSIILPAIEQEVNTGKNFAQLRQVYNSMILAVWFKKNLKEALLNQIYADKSKVNGVNVDDPAIKEKIYKQYLQAYKKGVFNYIKEENDPRTNEVIPRKYFSGGVTPFNAAMLSAETSLQAGEDISSWPADNQNFRVEGKTEDAAGTNAAMLGSVEKRHLETHIPALKARIQPIYDQLKPLVDQYWGSFQVQNRQTVSSFTQQWGADFKNKVADAMKGIIKGYPFEHGRIDSLISLDSYKEALGNNFAVVKSFVLGHIGDENFLNDFHLYVVARGASEKLESDINALVDQTNISQSFVDKLLRHELDAQKPLTLEQFKQLDNGVIYSLYVRKAKEAILRGDYVPQLLFAGKATRLNRGAMYPLDLWDLAKELGVELQPGDGDYNFGMGPRQLLAYRLLVTKIADEIGPEMGISVKQALSNQRIKMHLNDEVEAIAINDLEHQKFYGFNPKNIYFSNQPEFGGYRLNGREQLLMDENSPKLVYGHGDNVVQLDAVEEVYQLDDNGQKRYLQGDDFLTLMGQRYIPSNRINDLTKFLTDQVVDIEKFAMGMYLHDQGKDIVVDLVANPTKIKGGTATTSGLLESLAANGHPELMKFVNDLGAQGAPYNAFRLLYRADKLRKVLKNHTLPYYLRFKEGFFYVEAVTGDLTQFDDVRTSYIQREKQNTLDLKALKEVATNGVPILRQQDHELRQAGISPQGFATANSAMVATEEQGKETTQVISTDTLEDEHGIEHHYPNEVMVKWNGFFAGDYIPNDDPSSLLKYFGQQGDDKYVHYRPAKGEAAEEITLHLHREKMEDGSVSWHADAAMEVALGQYEFEPFDIPIEGKTILNVGKYRIIFFREDNQIKFYRYREDGVKSEHSVPNQEDQYVPYKLGNGEIINWKISKKGDDFVVNNVSSNAVTITFTHEVAAPSINPSGQEEEHIIGLRDDAMSAGAVNLAATEDHWLTAIGAATSSNELVAISEEISKDLPRPVVARLTRAIDRRSSQFDVEPGGIDLNAKNLNMESSGQRINITFDPAMIAQFRRGDFSGVRIQILDVVPIDLMSLLAKA